METNITIFHKTGDGAFSRYRPGDQLEQVFSTAVSLFDPPADDMARNAWLMEIAEHVWAAANDHPLAGWEKFTADYYDGTRRSLSVGDVVVIGRSALAVDSIGFNRVVLP